MENPDAHQAEAGGRSMMLASRIHRFGGPEVIELEEVLRPVPSSGEVLVRVRSAGVGPWDSLIRRGGSALGHSLPLIAGVRSVGHHRSGRSRMSPRSRSAMRSTA